MRFFYLCLATIPVLVGLMICGCTAEEYGGTSLTRLSVPSSGQGLSIGSAEVTSASSDQSSYDEFTLFAPLGNTTTYLVDEDGEVVHTWESKSAPALSAYLLEDGSLLRTTSLGRNANTVFGDASGAGGRVERLEWDGSKIWEFEYSSDEHLLHHDIEYLPNGNILMIAWKYKSEAEAIEAGRNPSLLADDELWPETIIEVKPDGFSGGTIVWEWHVWDHLVQDYDASKANYGAVSDHPEKIDVNYVFKRPSADWTHINAVDYNPDLDQILLTVHNFSEIWIIDHDTTTAEAAGSAGDLLYRWGNPQTYGRGTSSDQVLFVPHDGQWIESGCPGGGDVLVFNNGEGRPDGDYSSVDQITPPVDSDGLYSLTAGSAYQPVAASWTYQGDPPPDFYADHLSGAQRLPGGSTLVCEGTTGTFFEVTPEGKTVWEYTNPFFFTNPKGEKNNSVFRATRYSIAGLGGDEPVSGSHTGSVHAGDLTYVIVDTGQTTCYDDSNVIVAPEEGEAFYGQDAQYDGNQPSYTPSADGLTVYDNVTGLTWTQSPDLDGDGDIDVGDKLTFAEAQTYADSTLNPQNFGGYSDWRLPSMKQLYSLMDFRGTDPMVMGNDTSGLTPFVDTDYFDFAYGDTAAGERIIDAQFWSSNAYVGTVFGNQSAAFGLNLADGRIKGYPSGSTGRTKLNYVFFVRGNPSYGVNDFVDNGDGTVTDDASGLMWAQDDSGPQVTTENPTGGTGPRSGMTWKEALAWVQQKNGENYLGHSDWRLPNAKEMQSILDYSRAPDATGSAAIDPVFNITQIVDENGDADYPWFWTGTTHARFDGSGSSGVYICFGRALGYMNGSWLDVHGAGAQRSDQKSGAFTGLTYTPNGYYFGQSPQGDATRSYNYVRLVRDTTQPSGAVFPDVPSSSPYQAAIADLASRDIISGKTDGKFWPGDPVTRQQFAKMAVLTGGYAVSESDICTFTDVETSDASTFYPDNYVAVCASRGITLGKTLTTFDPYASITRYQVITMVVRMADDLVPGFLETPPPGWNGNTTWTADPTHGANAARAEYSGLLAGVDLSALDPYGNMSRGEVAQVLHNLLGKL